MTERRQAFRREPIEVDLGGEVISVAPIPWTQRNDFGNEVLRQHTEILNEAVHLFVEEDTETAIPQLQMRFSEKFSDPRILFEYGLDRPTFEQVDELLPNMTFEQITTILLAICDVNKMEQLHPLLDPNSLTPTPLGGMLSQMAEEGITTPKTESGPDSPSPDSPLNG